MSLIHPSQQITGAIFDFRANKHVKIANRLDSCNESTEIHLILNRFEFDECKAVSLLCFLNWFSANMYFFNNFHNK